MEEMDDVNRLSSSSAAVGIEGDANANRDEKIGSSCIGLDSEEQQHADQKLRPSLPSAALASLETTCEAEGEREGVEEEEDPGARTIEFLRARLLSERSVSKAARQRAELLAQKVLEVERQLEIVVEQRKKAEEETRQTLALLEDCTVADYSDAFDSGTDQDGASLHLENFQRLSTSTSLSLTFPGEEDEISTMSSASEKTLQNSEIHIDEQNGPERSHRVCRGLSWQARGNSRNQHENKKAFQTLEQIYLKNYHHGGVSDAKSGSRRRVGKSCRQIKRRETRPVTEEELRVPSDCGEDKTKKPTDSIAEPISEKDSEGSSLVRDQKVIYDNTLNQGTEEGDEIDLRNDQIGEQTSGEESTSRVHPECCVPYPSEDQERQIESGSDKEMEMERVLEQRAELIDQYEAEEDAQREWEEKFKELNCPPEQSTDCCRYEKQTRDREVSKDQEGRCLNRSKNVAATLNGEKKESNERSCESTSEKSHTVYSHCNEVENKAIHQMETNESQTCYVHGILPNFSCRLICSCDASSISKLEKVKGLPVLTNNFVQCIPLGNMQESQGNACAKTVSKEEKQEGGMPNYDLNSVMNLQVSNKDVETRDCIAEPSDNVDENMIEPYCCDIGPNLTEKAVLVLEKHIPIVSHANELLKLSASPVHDKALDAMHAMRLSGKDAVQGLPDNVRPVGEMVNAASMTQALKSEKHCSESKMARGDYKSSGGMMLATGKNPQNISQGSILRNSAEIITDSIPKECIGYSQSWHGSSNAEHRLSLMQGHRADLVANTTCASIHPYVRVNPMKSMSSLKMGSMEMQGQKENEERFDRTDYHGRASTSDANSMTRSQENVQVRPFNGQPERSTGVNESKMTNVEDVTPGPTTQNVRGVGFPMPYCGIRSSDILERGNTFVANHIPENRFCRTNMQDPSHVMINKIDTSPESREYYASLKHSGRVSQRTSETNDSSFQKNISRLDINNWSSAHELTDNYKNHSRGLFCGERVNPTTGNMGSSSMREFETYSELHTGNGTREESRMCQINQDHNRYAERVQLVAHHQSNSSQDVLMVLQLAKLELQNTLDKTQSVIQHPKIRASFMEESRTQKVMQPGNYVGAPLSCNELFRLPSEIDCKLPSQIRVSRPYLPDFNNNIFVGVPNNLSASVLNKLSANTSGRERLNLHFKHNQSDVDLSRRQWPSAGNQQGQQINYGFDELTVARGQWSSADNKRWASEKS